jgi:UDPglucose 6-dehydrogenase
MKVSVLGLGKLGCPLAAVLASKGFEVAGYDLSEAVVARLNEHQAPVSEPGLQELLDSHGERLKAYTDIEPCIADSEISFVIVPTPSLPSGWFDNSFVLDVVTKIGRCLAGTSRYHVVNIVSTVMPGSVGGEIRKCLESASGRNVGSDIGLTYNPEFIALGSVVHDMLHPDMILLGESDSRAGDLLESVYSTVVGTEVPKARLSLVDAEITKIAVNTYVTTKISFTSMLASVCEKMAGADALKVAVAVGLDTRIGRKYFRPGAPFGGPCFPRDAVAFSAFAKHIGGLSSLADATTSVNQSRIDEISAAVARATPAGARVGVLGLSYKPGTHVTEESFGVRLVERLVDTYSVTAWDRTMRPADYPANLSAIFSDLKNLLETCGVLVVALNDDEAIEMVLSHPSYRARASAIKVVDLWSVWPENSGNVVWRLGANHV